MNGYFAFNLTDSARAELLARIIPNFNIVIAHHVTYIYKPKDNVQIPDFRKVRVIGYAKNENIECVVVEVGGEKIRPDGKLYHITLSHNEFAKPVDSNHLLSTEGFVPIEHFELDVIPSYNCH